MTAEPPSAFANNWAYLKTELNWLERLLMLTLARQRQNSKGINRVARNPGDQASSHWWQGLITVNSCAYDEGPPPKRKAPQGKAQSYQQQLDARVQASEARGIWLAVPGLKKRLKLSLFEKNLVLLTLAPEVHLRYGRLYHYLQTGEDSPAGALPTVDLALRLLCRNDLDRQRARTFLAKNSALVGRQIIRCVSPEPRTLLATHLQLDADWANYLLAEQPNPSRLTQLLTRSISPQGLELTSAPDPSDKVPWDALIVPPVVKSQLQIVTQQVRPDRSGQTVLLLGENGTGKTTAARAIATALDHPLHIIDLSAASPETWLTQLDALRQRSLVLVKSAQKWFGRQTVMESARLTQWLNQPGGLVLLAVRYRHSVRASWRQRIDAIVELPVPDAELRSQLWQQSLPHGIRWSAYIDLDAIAKQLKLTGGQIHQITQTALALANGGSTVKLDHLQQALTQQGYIIQLKAKRRSSKKAKD
ncbi:MAG: AAA family ATPase [Cyanobacteria bacterium P01_G01_bin.38]